VTNLTVGQAHAINTLIRYLTGGDETPEKATEALQQLRAHAYVKLVAGATREDADTAIAAVEQLRAEIDVYRGDTRHIIELRVDGFTIQHPLACRPNLFDCPVNQAARRDLDSPPGPGPGRYYCDLADGWLAIGDPVDAPGVPAASNEAGKREDPQVIPRRTTDTMGLREHWAGLDPDGSWTSGENNTRGEAEDIIAFRERSGFTPIPVLAVRWESDWRIVDQEATDG
jgi:Family of unknown function (DUF6085)